jgi:hypothetical protein
VVQRATDLVRVVVQACRQPTDRTRRHRRKTRVEQVLADSAAIVIQCAADLVHIVVHACRNKRDIYAGTAVHRSTIDKCSRAACALLQVLRSTACTCQHWLILAPKGSTLIAVAAVAHCVQEAP